jgi:hypothetical protein
MAVKAQQYAVKEREGGRERERERERKDPHGDELSIG